MTNIEARKILSNIAMRSKEETKEALNMALDALQIVEGYTITKESIEVKAMKNLEAGKEIRKNVVTEAEIIVTGTKEKPYYEIKYKEVGNDYYDIGYSSYDLNIVFDYLDEYFEIKKDGESIR